MKITSLLFCFLLSVLGLQALNPVKEYRTKPETLNMSYEEKQVKVSDGSSLNSWYFPNPKKSKSLILLSMSGEGNMGDYLGLADQFLAMGYNVMMYDYRGFGSSSTFDMDNNMYIYPHFQDDLAAMLDYCRTNYAASFDLYGFGIGAGLSLGMGYHRPEVKNIIADTPFLSMEDLEKRFSNWDTPMEVPFAGFERKHEPEFTLLEEPNSAEKKIMLLLGSSDALYKEADMQKLMAMKPKLFSRLYLQENPQSDVPNYLVEPAAYFEAIAKFLGK